MVKTKADKDLDVMAGMKFLKEVCVEGTRVYAVVKHVSSSRMSRTIMPLVVEDGRIVDISWAVAWVLDLPFDGDRGGVKVKGVGMNMCFYLVNALSGKLGYKLDYCDL